MASACQPVTLIRALTSAARPAPKRPKAADCLFFSALVTPCHLSNPPRCVRRCHAAYACLTLLKSASEKVCEQEVQEQVNVARLEGRSTLWPVKLSSHASGPHQRTTFTTPVVPLLTSPQLPTPPVIGWYQEACMPGREGCL